MVSGSYITHWTRYTHNPTTSAVFTSLPLILLHISFQMIIPLPFVAPDSSCGYHTMDGSHCSLAWHVLCGRSSPGNYLFPEEEKPTTETSWLSSGGTSALLQTLPCTLTLSPVQLFCDPRDCGPPGSSILEIFQERILV